jgi:hypothetical protein
MSEALEPIIEPNSAKVPKKKGRPLKTPLATDYVPKPVGRPKKTLEEIKQYHRDYYQANKERIMQKRVEYRNTPNYKAVRHMQNERYKQRQAQKPRVCLINLALTEAHTELR